MITLVPLDDIFLIYQFHKNGPIPPAILASDFYSITQTEDELSVLTNCKDEFDCLNISKTWKGFKVKGVLDFSLVGIIHDITKPLKDDDISVFVVSTYNTDYLFVKEEVFEKTIEVLSGIDYIHMESI